MKPARIWTIGRDGNKYRTAIRLWGYRFHRLRIHFFHRGDLDLHPHDHPNDFWTFPLCGYWEEVYDIETGQRRVEYVKPFRAHFRPAEYVHRVLGAKATWHDPIWHYSGWFLTIVKEGPARRPWGFWVWDHSLNCAQFVYWRKYFGEEG